MNDLAQQYGDRIAAELGLTRDQHYAVRKLLNAYEAAIAQRLATQIRTANPDWSPEWSDATDWAADLIVSEAASRPTAGA